MADKKYPTIGCCGIDCGLCPRYYTDGASRCPGCGGEGFALKHPACGFLSCCVKKHGMEVCAECRDFPCRKFDKETGERDSFVTHRKIWPNQQLIEGSGIEEFLEQQRKRIAFLEMALDRYDDARSKNFFCLAAALLSVDSLYESLSLADKGENLKAVLTRLAEQEGQELKLRK